MPIMLGIVCISDVFVPIFFGAGYEKVSLLIKIICPIILFIGISNIIGTQYLLPTKKQKNFTISVTAGAVINFLLNIFFIYKFGAIGACIATVIAEFVVTAIQSYSIRKDFNIMEFILLGKNNFIAAIIMFTALIGINYLVKKPIISLFLQISIGAIIYIGILFVLKDSIIIDALEKIKTRGKVLMEKIKKLNIQKIFIIFIIIQPVIDIITSILVRHVSNILTLGIFVRAIFMIAIVIYSFIISEKKYKIKMLIYYGAFAIYSVLFIFAMYKDNGTNMIFSQIKGLIKCFYFPIVMCALYPVICQKKVQISNTTFIYTLLGYTLTIFVTKILGIAYPTYSIGLNVGTTGLFYAANEIGIILGILAIFLFNNTFLKNIETTKEKILYVASIVLYIFSVLEMGTKVPILAFAGIFAVTFIFCIIKIFKKNKKLYLRKILGMICMLIIIGVCLPYTAVGKNVERNYGIKFVKILEINFDNPKKKEETNQEEKKFNNKEEITTAVVSGRNLFLKNNVQDFKNSGLINKAVGIGYADKNEEGYFDRKTVEIDYCDIAFLQGIIGFVLFFIPITVFTFMVIKKFFKNFKNVILNEDCICMIAALGLSAFVAMFAGHTLVAPAVSIYIAIIFVKLNYDLAEKEKEIV